MSEAKNESSGEATTSSELLCCRECGNTFIECFPSWWVGCKPCNNHVSGATRSGAVSRWNKQHNQFIQRCAASAGISCYMPHGEITW
jgi:protein-arginine kinase activator protein McsA